MEAPLRGRARTGTMNHLSEDEEEKEEEDENDSDGSWKDHSASYNDRTFFTLNYGLL